MDGSAGSSHQTKKNDACELESAGTVLVSAGTVPARLHGYISWWPSLLKLQFFRGSWMYLDATPVLVFPTDPDELWDDLTNLATTSASQAVVCARN